MKDGFFRIACATPPIELGNCDENRTAILHLAKEAAKNKVGAIVFPELCLTGATCGDLFFQQTLLASALKNLEMLVTDLKNDAIICMVGLPLLVGNSIYNCAAITYGGAILGIVPKTSLGHRERRQFSAIPNHTEVFINNTMVPFGTHLLFSCTNFTELTFGIEFGGDIWQATAPSTELTAAGATIMFALSAGPQISGISGRRQSIISELSRRLQCAYAFSNAGQGESTTDLIYAGHNLIANQGAMMAELPPFKTGVICTEIDLQMLVSERASRKLNNTICSNYIRIYFLFNKEPLNIQQIYSKNPFLPKNTSDYAKRFSEIFALQSAGLAHRLTHTNTQNMVIGLSGGLDSTLALLVALETCKNLQLSPKNIIAVTMPCFGTTTSTKTNAKILAESTGITFYEIDITNAVNQHFKDINHDTNNHDHTFENAQARERTQILMDLANQHNALVVGTGDLSELALGFATYNGDHMSMYNVNVDIPKTLVIHLVQHYQNQASSALQSVLQAIIETPISPELLPPINGEIAQVTETVIGPYILHDFFLYYALRYKFTPSKILRLACIAFIAEYDEPTIKKWLKLFYNRFFSQQFKRSCSPDGPAIGTISLSPRGGFMMPSDAHVTVWLKDLETL